MSWNEWLASGFPKEFQADSKREMARSLDRSFQEFARDYGDIFESVFGFLLIPINWFENLLELIPAGFFLIFVCVSLLSVRRYISAILVPVLMILVGYFGAWEAMNETIAFLLIVLLLTSIIAVPLGVAAGQNEIASKIVQLILDSITFSFGFILISAIVLLGIGKVPSVLFVFLVSLSFMFRWVSSGIINSKKTLPAYLRGDVWTQVCSAREYVANGFSTTVAVILLLSIFASMIGLGGLSSDILRGISNQYFAYALFASVGVIAVGLYVSRMFAGLTYMTLGRDA